MALTITLKVVPRSSRTGCGLNKQGTLVCHLKSPPENGKANDELITYLSKTLGVTKAKIHIKVGFSQRTKIISIDVPMTYEQLLEALGVELQGSLPLSG